MSKKYFTKRLIVLATVLLLAWVGISCKSKKPTEGGFELERPDDKVTNVGGSDGMLNEEQKAGYNNEMLHIRLLADSMDGEAYYRSPVVVTYNDNKGIAMFLEKRYGAGGVDDVGVDGNARVDIIYFANNRGGNELNYGEGSGNIVGLGSSAKNDFTLSKASAVVFANGNEITVVAASGSGAMPERNGLVSEVKIIKGTAGSDSITWSSDWTDLNITYTPDGASEALTGSEAIKAYVGEKVNANYNSIYTRWGKGKIDGQKFVLPLTLIQKNGTANVTQGLLVLYSEDAGATWKFGPSHNFDQNTYKIATGLSVSGTTVTLAAVPNVTKDKVAKPIGIYTATLEDASAAKKDITQAGQSSFNDSENNFEIAKGTDGSAYFINTRNRTGQYMNGFVINELLTLAVLSDADKLQENSAMQMSKACGIGSVAVLKDGTIVTVAEEAFAEGSGEGENRFNVVQRRFTRGYLDARVVNNESKIRVDDEYYNPNLGGLGGGNN
ncbi:hypothetical protein [Brachyspira catarrhinii]|uniref:Exo-alpha-sialidase n=1 Tax=Brachyspira catarrhinii TaxID=2528966 RepID=A0ABY2TWE8_9SPIR|nr:hypothetical protein [Brachyspira catarrhinii]TKZ35967.1 hypothetical protein EZH24_02620 [Brachyspira catarrhinii]